MTHAVLNERYHLDKQTSLDRDGRQCMSAGIAYSYCRLRPVLRDTDQFLQVAMGMKQWDCVSFTFTFSVTFFSPPNFLITSVGQGFTNETVAMSGFTVCLTY